MNASGQRELPRLLGRALCLDFVNTVDVHDGIPAYDDLQPGYANLLAWCTWVDVVDEATATKLLRLARKEARAAAEVRKRAVALREALFRLARHLIADTDPDTTDLALLEREILDAHRHRRLRPENGALAWEWPEEMVLERLLWPIVVSAEDLLLSPDVGRIRECAGEECQWLFLDTTKNRSRRYCSPAGCGNRERVRRFRQQRAEDPAR